MDYSDLIQQALNHIDAGQKNSYTPPLLNLVQAAIAEQRASAEDQDSLRDLAQRLESLLGTPTKPNFPGSGTTSL